MTYMLILLPHLFSFSQQRLADTLETKEEELQRKDRDLKMKVQHLLTENAELRNQVALKEGGAVAEDVVGTKENEDSTFLPISHDNPQGKVWKDQQRTPATSCDLTSGEEELFDCEATVVHLLASHCSVVSSSSRHLIPSPSLTSYQRPTACVKQKRKLPRIKEPCRGAGDRRPNRGGRSLAWIYSPFIPRRIIASKEAGNDGVSDLSSCS